MKIMLICALILLSMPTLIGCTTTSEIRPYTQNSSLSTTMQKGVVFSLPKTVFEVKITYSLYAKHITSSDTQGSESKTDYVVVYVEKPIEIRPITIPDQNAKFVFDTESLNGFTKDSSISLELTNNGMLKTTNMDIKDKTKEIVANVTGAVLNIAKAAPAGRDAAELTHIKDISVLRILDPSSMNYIKNGSVFIAEYSDAEKTEGLLHPHDIPDVVVTLKSPTDIRRLSSIDTSRLMSEGGNYLPLKGFPYRTGSSIEIVVSVDGMEVYDSYHMTAQGGGLALIPVNAKTFTNMKQGLSFGDDGSLDTFASTETSQGEAMSATAKDTADAIFTGLQDIEQAKIDKLKKEKELINAQIALEEAKKK